MNKNIEVEGREIAIRNSHGDLAIIPKNKVNWVKQKLSEGCHDCIDSLVETLPIASQYAQDGSVYPPGKKVKVNQDNQIKEYDINSKEYRDLYNSGKLTTYDKTTDTYSATPLKEVTATAEAPQWLKYKREYEKNNPKKDYINKYLTPFAKSLGNTETNYPKRLDAEYEQKSLDYIGEQLFKNKPQGKLSRVEWLNQMSDKEEEIIKRNPKYQSSLWADTKRGLTSLVEKNPLQTFQNILNSSDYTNREKQEMLKDYADHPVMSKLGDAAKILNPLTVPSKMVQSAYKDDYSFKDALKGKKNNAGLVEDIVTDPLNLVGAGLVGKLSKADKVIDATKAGSKVLNKTDDIVKSSASLVDDAAYPVTRTTPNSGYTFKTISPNKEKIAIHESNKYHDLMWVAKNDIDNFFINNKIDVSKLPESKLVGSEVGYDWILPEGITHDMLNEFARLHHGKPITQEMRNITKAIKEANPNVKFNGTSHELHGIASNIHPEYLGKMGQGLSNVGKAGSKVLNKTGDVASNINKIKNKPVQNGFLFDKKGFMQQYPKGDLTEMEINAVRNTDEYKILQSDYLKYKEKHGDNWKLNNYYEEAIQKNDRDAINTILYGGNNYKTINYVGTAMVGYLGVSLPPILGLLGLSTFGNKNQILNIHKKLGLYDPTDLGFLTSKDTVIDISDKKMDYAKVNEDKDGKVILGGEFIEETNNSVRKVKDWINADSLDTFGDKKIKTKDINKFYGVENNKFKVGTLKDFDKETEVVPVRFKDIPIKKAVLNNKELRLLDNDDKPIYQNTPNTGKFILHSPSSKKSIFVYINEGKKGVDEVNKFLKQNGDAFYIHLDNGRYEFYGINEDGLTKQNFENYYEQDLKRKGNPGYNLIIK